MTLADIQAGINAAYQTALQIKADIIALGNQGLDNASDSYDNAKDAVYNYVSGAVSSAGNYLNISWNEITAKIDKAVTDAKNLLNGSFDAVLDKLGNAINDSTQYASNLYDNVKNYLGVRQSEIYDSLSNMKTNIYDWIAKEGERLSKQTEDIQKDVQSFFDPKLDYIENKLRQIPIDVGMFVSALTDQVIGMKEVMLDFKTGLFDKLDDLLTIEDSEVDKILEHYKKKL